MNIQRMYGIGVIFLWFFLSCGVIIGKVEKHIVVVIPSYNNERWVEKNLSSALNQNYQNYNIIYVDDCSRDTTYQRAIELVERSNQQSRVRIIHNESRSGAMANWYRAIHLCDDNDIIVQLDGDDWLAHDNVLSYINNVYSGADVWITYGQCMEHPLGRIYSEASSPFSEEVIQNNLFRRHLDATHLRTCYAWLFKSIKLQDFLYEGDFYKMACDTVITTCSIEMAGRHHYRVPDVLYVYNNTNPISDHQVNRELQHALSKYIIELPPYKPLKAKRNVELFDQFDHVQVIELNKDSHVGAQCEEFVNNGTSRYVLFSTNQMQQESTIFEPYIRLLNKTQADVLYLIGEKDRNIIELIAKGALPNISFFEPAYAYRLKNDPAMLKFPVIGAAIWRRESLAGMRGLKESASLQEVQKILIDYMRLPNTTGVIFYPAAR